MIHKLQYIIHLLQSHYSDISVMLSGNYRCIIVGYWIQLWGVFQYLVLSVLQEVMVGHIAYGILHITEYVFPDMNAPEVEFSGLLRGSGTLHYISPTDTILVLHLYSRESCSMSYSPSGELNSPTNLLVVTPFQLSQSAVCICLLLPLRRKTLPDPFYLPLVLLAY